MDIWIFGDLYTCKYVVMYRCGFVYMCICVYVDLHRGDVFKCIHVFMCV